MFRMFKLQESRGAWIKGTEKRILFCPSVACELVLKNREVDNVPKLLAENVVGKGDISDRSDRESLFR